MSVTRMPEVIDALIDVLNGIGGFQVTDGPIIGELMDNAVVVGLTEGPESPGYRTELEPLEGLGRRRYRERWTIHCLLTLATGQTDMAALRSRAGGMLAQIIEALRDEAPSRPRPWDAVPAIARTEWAPIQSPQGAVINIVFDIDGSCLL